MPRRRQFSPIEWLIVITIAGVLFAVTAPSRSPRSRAVRHSVATPAARATRPAAPVELPDAANRVASPPSVLHLWRRVQNPLLLALALRAIARALRRDRRPRPKAPAAPEGSPAP